MEQHMSEIIILFFLLLPICFTVCIILWNRYHTGKQMDKAGEMLDCAINGTFIETTYDESKLSALECKLNRYLSSTYLSSKNLSEEKDKIKSFISDISHQTKTPLSNIILYSGLLAETEQTEENRYYIDQITNQTEKLHFLIDALVKTSRLETGIITVQPERNSIHDLIQTVMVEMKPKAERKRIEIILKDCEGMADFDKKWTGEAICNIIDNAIKYSLEESSIQIAGCPYEMFYRLDIMDYGLGIKEDEISKIFGRFYRSQEVKEYEGVGIGLYLSREIITLQGGYIKLSSVVGKGSTFSVFLPICKRNIHP